MSVICAGLWLESDYIIFEGGIVMTIMAMTNLLLFTKKSIKNLNLKLYFKLIHLF